MLKKMKLSVVIPVFNEIKFIDKCIKEVLSAKRFDLDLEIIISDNNSNDGTKEYLKKINNPLIKILFQETNYGKGSNIINAFKFVTGDIILIQDADLENSPEDYEDLLKPIINQRADVVFGNRFSGSKPFHVYSLAHYFVNRFVTFFFNILYNRSFSDVLTGYKVFNSNVLKKVNLISRGFDIETEITSKIVKISDIRIYEVGVSIYSRRYNEGKKVHWYHLFIILFSIIKWKLIKK